MGSGIRAAEFNICHGQAIGVILDPVKPLSRKGFRKNPKIDRENCQKIEGKSLTIPNTEKLHGENVRITFSGYILNFSKKWRGRQMGEGGFKMRDKRKETALRAVSLSSQMSTITVLR